MTTERLPADTGPGRLRGARVLPLHARHLVAGTTGFWGLLVVWIAIAAINIGYAMRLRPPTDRH